MIRFGRIFVGRWRAFLAVLALSFASAAQGGIGSRESALSEPKRPVVLVHGIRNDGDCMEPMARYLRKQGHRAYTVSLKPNLGQVGLDELAGQLRDFVDRTIPKGQPFDLVGFSMGGLVSRYYVQRLGGKDRVRHFVSISTPHRGTMLAIPARVPGCQQMRPGSPFLKDLDRDAVAVFRKVRLTCFWTPLDSVILPAASCTVSFGDNRRVWCFAHPLMIYERRCMRLVADALAEPTATRSFPPAK